MNIFNDRRLERIIKKLLENKEIVESSEKGNIEINFAGDKETISIKIIVQ